MVSLVAALQQYIQSTSGCHESPHDWEFHSLSKEYSEFVQRIDFKYVSEHTCVHNCWYIYQWTPQVGEGNNAERKREDRSERSSTHLQLFLASVSNPTNLSTSYPERMFCRPILISTSDESPDGRFCKTEIEIPKTWGHLFRNASETSHGFYAPWFKA